MNRRLMHAVDLQDAGAHWASIAREAYDMGFMEEAVRAQHFAANRYAEARRIMNIHISAIYRLHSSPLFHTPGIVRWAINGYAFSEDRERMLDILTHGYKLPRDVARALLSEEVKYSVEDETVVFEF